MSRRTTESWLTLCVFVGGVLAAGFLIGYASSPQPAYASIIKPSFAPPAWLFGPVWSLLYVMMAVAGWRLFELDRSSIEMRFWWGQLVLNFLWSPVFFLGQGRTLALAIIVALLIALLILISRLWNRDRASAVLLVPYAAWVAFATTLNAAIVHLN